MTKKVNGGSVLCDNMLWERIERELGLDHGIEKSFRRDNRGTRVYVRAVDVWKVQLREQKFVPEYFVNNLKQEAAYIDLARSIPGIVKVKRIWSDAEKTILVLGRVSGTQLNRHTFNYFDLVRIIAQLLILTSALTKRRILHGDLAIHNFMLTPSGQVVVIDFGQAQTAPFWTCVTLNFFRRGMFLGKSTFPISGTVARCIEFSLPEKWRSLYRKIIRIAPYVPNAY